ncbi:MAG: 5'-deoxyadenosine deaminase [Bdellovibrionales bacterium]|nr:5'-deoxyadenosine deaminase [Bdellovibrionales bacterium]
MLLLENALIVSNDRRRRVFRGSVRIEDGHIAKTGRNLRPLRGETRVDLSGQVLIPGFVQTHVHLCQTLFRNLADDLQLLDWLRLRIWPFEAAHTEKSLRASARLGIAELLAGGTTTVLDMGTVRHTSSLFEAAEEMGIRAFIGKCLMDHPESPRALRESTRAALDENLELISRWHGAAQGRLRYAQAPRFALSCTTQLLESVRDISRDLNLLVHTHSSENREEIKAVRRLHGCNNVEFFERIGLAGPRLVLAHCIWLSPQEVRILSRTGTKVSHCPSSNLKLASGIAPVPRLRGAGVCVSLGADGAPCNNNLDMFQEMRLASLVQKPEHGPESMRAQEVFEMATLEGARALGMEKEIGSIEPGKKADLVALDLLRPESLADPEKPGEVISSIVYSCSPGNVTHTWVDGRLVCRRGEPRGASRREIVREALAERRKLLRRV